MFKVKLSKNLRRSILQGNPWIYRDAIDVFPKVEEASLCAVSDKKGDHLGWGMFDPNSILSLRMVSLARKPPNEQDFSARLASAASLRFHLSENKTNGYRLFNGEGDGLPGLVCDCYGRIAVLQFDGDGPFEFWDQEWIANWILENTKCESVYYKPRHDQIREAQVWGKEQDFERVFFEENGVQFLVDVKNGQKTGFFLDQRDNRDHVGRFANGKSIANLFSYSGGFSLYCGLGGAKSVLSVDIASSALDIANQNWSLNNLRSSLHSVETADVFEFVETDSRRFDLVICDPPSLAKSEKNKEAAIRKYTRCFSGASKMTSKQGHLMLSSCSSHINHRAFIEIVSDALSMSRRTGRVLKVGGQGADHPYPHACPHLRYLKFIHLLLD